MWSRALQSECEVLNDAKMSFCNDVNCVILSLSNPAALFATFARHANVPAMHIPMLMRLAFLAFCTWVLNVPADDWPQWQGPRRDGVWRESGLVGKFPANGPPVRWRTNIGAGYSGPIVAGGRV